MAQEEGRTTTREPTSSDEVRGQTRRSVLIIVGLLLIVVMLHLYADTVTTNTPLQFLYRRLYYVPILYAAFVFGKKGGALAACVASIPFALHAQASLGGFCDSCIDNLLEIVMYFAMGILFGALRDLEESKTHDLRQVSFRLEDAYKKLEERAIQLINIQDYTQSILRSITSGVLTVGPDGLVTTANPAAEQIVGALEHEIVPRSIQVLFRDDGGLSADVEKVLSGRTPVTLRDTKIVAQSGRTIHVQISTSRMRAVGGRTLGAVVTIEDMSEIKALTEQLIRADRLAAMGELTAGVAHEVRNPLGVIRVSVQLLEDPQRDPEQIRATVEVIKQEIDRLDTVIKALLDFGRPSSPTLVLTDVEEVLEDVLMFTGRFAKQSDVRIEKQFAGDIPHVRADPNQLKQVFLNLVTNAVQSMEETGGLIVVKTKRDGDFVDIIVSDSGSGISPENVNKIFDPFFSTRDEGTGLGLTIVHRIIDEHDGHIEVESGPDGTIFKLSFPVAIEMEEDLSRESR